MLHRIAARSTRHLTAALVILTTASAFFRAADLDDRGSDSTEKSLMTIAAITIGGIVTVGVVAFVTAKVGLFK